MNPNRKYLLLAAILTAALSYGVLWRGINIGPDGWAFWEGSVSLMMGHGYAHFYHHLPIQAWPPLYSLYLAAWQLLFGVSGATLITSTILLSIIAVLGWARLALELLELSSVSGRHAKLLRWLLPAFVIAFVAYYFKGVGIDALRFALLPYYLLAFLPMLAEARLPDTREAVILVLLGLMQVLVHNASLAFVLSAGLVLAVRHRSARGLACAAMLVGIPVAGWLSFRYALGLEHSHVIHLALEPFRLVDLFGKSYADLSNLLFGPRDHSIVLTGIALYFAASLSFRFAARNASVSSARWKGARSGLALFAALSWILTLLFCHVTLLMTVTRYIWFVPLIAVPLLLPTAAAQERRWKFHAAVVLFLVPAFLKIALLIGATATDWKGYVSNKPQDRFVTPDMYIDARQPEAAPIRTEQGLLVSPPVYEWLERRAEEGEE